jgi:hypothetical protein
MSVDAHLRVLTVASLVRSSVPCRCLWTRCCASLLLLLSCTRLCLAGVCGRVAARPYRCFSRALVYALPVSLDAHLRVLTFASLVGPSVPCQCLWTRICASLPLLLSLARQCLASVCGRAAARPQRPHYEVTPVCAQTPSSHPPAPARSLWARRCTCLHGSRQRSGDRLCR